jgi:hypothetical protein
MLRDPVALGLFPTLELSSAPKAQTFEYRGEHKRVIESAWANATRLRKVKGPCVYVVTDAQGIVRYIGKHEDATPVGCRWYRREHIHHASSRNHVIGELDAGRGPCLLWSAAVEEIRSRLPVATRHWDAAKLAQGLEAEWIARWRPQLWNHRHEPTVAGFTDGQYMLAD